MIVTPHRTLWPGFAAVLLFVLGHPPLAADAPGAPSQGRPKADRLSGSGSLDDEAVLSGTRIREGGRVQKQEGSFHLLGDRVLFRPGLASDSLPVLENLALERVMTAIEKSPDLNWSVSGTITEFRGRNYLLLDRAVIRARVPGPSTADASATTVHGS